MNNSPCFNCPERRMGCHSNCVSYKKFRKNRQAISEIRQQLYHINSYHSDVVRKAQKLRRLHP